MNSLERACQRAPLDQLFALIDPLGVTNLYARLEATGCEYSQLANGKSSMRFARVSPYIAKVDMGRRFHLLTEDATAKESLIFGVSGAALEKVRARLFMFYFSRFENSNMYMRIANVPFFITLMSVLTLQQARLLGTRIDCFIAPQMVGNEDRIYRYDSSACRYDSVP